MKIYYLSIFLVLVSAQFADARNYYVSNTGNDNAAGTFNAPFLTINKAAEMAMPGDTIIVRGGVYREWVKPLRGGTSEEKRIVYKAYPGETPVIKGSERITDWVKESGSVWRVEVDDSLFGNYNPFITNVGGRFFRIGGENHVGDVFLNETWYTEQFIRTDIDNQEETWYTEHRGNTTIIWANFGDKNPNEELAEIRVRECVFAPVKEGLSYITVDGFKIMQGASNWVGNEKTQRAMMLTMGGTHWIIQNCHLTLSKCVALSGATQNMPLDDINKMGHHHVRYNLIDHCGQSGISGQRGWTASIIEGNVIQDINKKEQFGGDESGGIKIHVSADLLIKNNIVRRVRRVRKLKPGTYPGIWIDWRNQGIRITGNVIYDIDMNAIFMEMNRGRNLVDHNIIMNEDLSSCSERLVVAHNLFYNSRVRPRPGMVSGRTVEYLVPHATTAAGKRVSPQVGLEDKYYNNVYINEGGYEPPTKTGFVSDYNVFYDGAEKYFGNKNSIVSTNFNTNFSYTEDFNSVTISYTINSSPIDVGAPLIDRDFIGVDELTKSSLEDRDGNPISLDRDVVGNLRSASSSVAGPFAAKSPGRITLKLIAGPQANPQKDSNKEISSPWRYVKTE